MENLFGHEATEHEIRYCHRTSENTNPVYVGAFELLWKLLHEEAATWKSLDITEILEMAALSLEVSMARNGGQHVVQVHSWEAVCLVHITRLGNDGMHNTRRPVQ